MKNRILRLLFALAILLSANHVPAQGTLFTYQGQLNSSSAPANGLYDLMFDLYDAPTNGTHLGNVSLSAVSVTGGLFTVSLDFGAQFSGGARWLEISVQPHGTSGYTSLIPLQAILPAPYSIMANSASNLLGQLPASQLTGTISNSALPSNTVILGTITASNFSGNGNSLTNLSATHLTGTLSVNQLPANLAYLDGNQNFTGFDTFALPVGIGTTSPQASLQVVGGILANGGPPGGFGLNDNGYAFSGNGGDDDSGMFSLGNGQIEFFNNANEAMRIENGHIGIGTTNPTAPLQVIGNTVISGNVGIGTANPAAPLQVEGPILLGTGGTNYATSGPENLRIIRGLVGPNGTIVSGTGFTVVSNAVGIYSLTFTPPFANYPAVTASSFTATATLVNLGLSGVQIYVYSLGTPTLVNQYFTFIAAGP